jgi:hypothetical protein
VVALKPLRTLTRGAALIAALDTPNPEQISAPLRCCSVEAEGRRGR